MGILDGKRALITGAGIGIGQGIARETAQEGATVVLHYGGSKDGAEEVVAEIESAGGRAVAIQANLREADECARLVDEAAEFLGGLDVLVNNAGVTRAQPFEETTEELYDEMFDLNIKGYFYCAQRAMKHMGRDASIVNITSVHGMGGMPDHAAYAGTKGAVIAFTRTLGVELAPRGIRVNAIGPGAVEVPRFFDFPGYTHDVGNTWQPLGRVGEPADIAQAAVFLASDKSSWITGETLMVDGGVTARMGIRMDTEE